VDQQKDHGHNQPDHRDHIEQAGCEIAEHEALGSMVAKNPQRLMWAII
jgi:hypothetical protein